MMQPGDTAVADRNSQADEVLRELEQRIGSRTFNLWVRDNASIEISQGQVTVNVHNKFLLNWLKERYRPAITQAVQSVLGDGSDVRFRELPRPTAEKISGALRSEVASEACSRPEPLPSRPHTAQTKWRGSAAREKGAAAAPSPLAALSITTIAHSCARRAQVESKHSPQVAPTPNPSRASGSSDDPRSNASQPRGPSQAASATPPAPPSGRRFADLNDFVAGPGNELAFTAALQVCEQPGGYNPLVLHGGVGIGKTHLLEGIYRRMRARYPAYRVVFLSAESFANYFTQALRDRTLASFRQRFRGVDVLMIDDVDFLDGKRVIQEEFLHTMRQLESHGRQVALTTDRHPRLLTRLSEELVTRFMAGIVCRLVSPDVDTRRTIVARKAARLATRVTDDAIEFIVQRFTLSVRELDGALNFLENYGQTTGKTINLAVARNVLADLDRDCVRIVRVADVEQAVCRLFSIGPEALRSSRRTRSVSQPRMLAMYLARKMTQAAYTEIGEHFGGRNHSTVMSAEKRVRSLLEADAIVRAGTQEWKLGDLLTSLEQQLLTG
jgi:chromosomal replication initiator protein